MMRSTLSMASSPAWLTSAAAASAQAPALLEQVAFLSPTAAAAALSTASALMARFSSGSPASSTAAPAAQQQQQCQPQLHVSVEPLADEDEGISVLVLNRPQARNAIGRQFLRELSESVDMLRRERSTRCVIVRSLVPGVFCAGADLKERAVMTQQETAEFVTALRRTFTELQQLPMPTVAALEGLALGGGAELAMACDLRVATRDTVFAFPETQLGIIPGAGGTQRLPRLVGLARAKELIFTCRRVGGEEAARIGLVDLLADQLPQQPVSEPDVAAAAGPGSKATCGTAQKAADCSGVGMAGAAFARALELARGMARGAPLALRAAKAAVELGAEVSLAAGMRVEEAQYGTLLPTKDRLEGLAAFAAKRRPQYKGE